MNKPAETVQSLMVSADATETNGDVLSRKRLKKSNLDHQPLLAHYVSTYDLAIPPLIKTQRLCLCSCSQLKLSKLTGEFCLQVTKNLVYLSKRLLISHPEHFDFVVQRCCRLTTIESTKHPNKVTRHSSVLKWIAALVLELSASLTKHLNAFLTMIERELERDETITAICR